MLAKCERVCRTFSQLARLARARAACLDSPSPLSEIWLSAEIMELLQVRFVGYIVTLVTFLLLVGEVQLLPLQTRRGLRRMIMCCVLYFT